MSALRPEMDRLVRALISHVTNFDDGSDDNFDSTAVVVLSEENADIYKQLFECEGQKNDQR